MAQATITLSLDNLRGEDRAPLYCKYPQQINPQPAYVMLAEDGEVSAYSSGEIGGTPMRVAHMRDLTWSVSPYARPGVLADLLVAGEARALLERVHAGHSVEWDGNNYRGQLTQDAQAASDALERLLADKFNGGDPDSCVQVWSAGDWLFSACGLLDHWSDQSLDDAVAAIESGAEAEGVMLTGDVRNELLDAAQRRFDEDGDDGLTSVHLAALVADGRITDEQAAARSAG